VTTGQTGTPLSVPMLFRTRDKIELSFPLRVASVAVGKPLTIEPDRLQFGDRPIATASDYALPISYYGPRHTIRTVSAANLIDGQIDKEAIQGRIVVLGATATGAGDFFPTPFDSLMPGVEIISDRDHASGRRGRFGARSTGPHRRGRHDDPASDAAGRPAGVAAKRDRSADGHRGDAGMGGRQYGSPSRTAYGSTPRRRWPRLLPPMVLFGTLQLWSGRRSAQHLAVQNRLLEQFQTPGLQEWLTRDPDFLLAPVRQNAAVVFVDLSGFTSLSETLDPDATRGLLKEFHALVDKEVTRCGGMITSFSAMAP
jgi:adenylate cyclase